MADDKAISRIERKHAFVLDEETVKSLWKLISDCGMTVEAAIKCSGNVVKSYAKRDQLLRYHNARSARIKSLEINGRDNHQSAIRLHFGEYGPETISGSISCDRPALYAVKDQVSQILEGTKPRYSAFATFSDIGLMTIVMVLVLALIAYLFDRFMGSSQHGAKGKVVFTNTHVIHVALVMAGILIAIFAIPFGIQKTREFLFPKHVFALGQGKQRYEFLKRCRPVVFIGAIVTLVVGLAAAVVATHAHI